MSPTCFACPQPLTPIDPQTGICGVALCLNLECKHNALRGRELPFLRCSNCGNAEILRDGSYVNRYCRSCGQEIKITPTIHEDLGPHLQHAAKG